MSQLFEGENLAALIIVGIVAAVGIILGIVLLTGRGTGLIAGYNTMSKTEQKKWNAKALARATGIFLICFVVLVVAISVLVMLEITRPIPVLGVVLAGGTAFFIIYGNKSKRLSRIDGRRTVNYILPSAPYKL